MLTHVVARGLRRRERASDDLLKNLSPGVKRENSVLLGGDGCSEFGRGTEAPAFESGEAFVVDVGAHAFEHSFVGNLSALIDGDFDDHASFGIWQLPRIYDRVGGRDGQRGVNVRAEKRSANERAVGKSRGR